MDYAVYKDITDARDEDGGPPGNLTFIGVVTADHSTAAILSAAHQWWGEGEGTWVAIRVEHISSMPVTFDKTPGVAS